MHVTGGCAVGNHRHRQARRVGGVVEDLDVEHGGEAAKALGADAERVDLVEQFEAQFLDAAEGPAARGLVLQFVDVDRIHERFLGQQQRLFGRAADADAEDARRAPAGAHGRDGLQHPVHDRVGRVEHGQLRLVLGAAALGRTDDLDLVAGDDFVVHHGRGVVLAVLALAGWIEKHRGAQLVVRIEVGAAHAFVHHFLHAQGGVPAHVHADLEEDHGNPGVLADRAVAFGAHARVGQDLRDGVTCGGAFLALPGFAERLDVVERMVVADELEGVGDGLDEVFLADGGHGRLLGRVCNCIGWPLRGWISRVLFVIIEPDVCILGSVVLLCKTNNVSRRRSRRAVGLENVGNTFELVEER